LSVHCRLKTGSMLLSLFLDRCGWDLVSRLHICENIALKLLFEHEVIAGASENLLRRCCTSCSCDWLMAGFTVQVICLLLRQRLLKPIMSTSCHRVRWNCVHTLHMATALTRSSACMSMVTSVISVIAPYFHLLTSTSDNDTLK